NYITLLSIESQHIFPPRHEIQQPPFPYIIVCGFVENKRSVSTTHCESNLAGLGTSIRRHQCNELGFIPTRNNWRKIISVRETSSTEAALCELFFSTRSVDREASMHTAQEYRRIGKASKGD